MNYSADYFYGSEKSCFSEKSEGAGAVAYHNVVDFRFVAIFFGEACHRSLYERVAQLVFHEVYGAASE